MGNLYFVYKTVKESDRNSRHHWTDVKVVLTSQDICRDESLEDLRPVVVLGLGILVLVVGEHDAAGEQHGEQTAQNLHSSATNKILS